jgi:hypothetical protein
MNVKTRLSGSFQSDMSSSGWTRTSNPSINSRMLCQLSYRGMREAGGIVANRFWLREPHGLQLPDRTGGDRSLGPAHRGAG